MGDRNGEIKFDPAHYSIALGTAWTVCLRCAVLIQPIDAARQLHSDWHRQVDELIAAAEHERTMRMERDD
jgi:hypothetical protein